MTAEVNKTNPAREGWLWRKGVYYILGGLLAIAAVIGWITIEQLENGLALYERVVPSIASVALIIAGNKTHRGSDEDITHGDMEEAAAKASSTAANSVLRERLDQTNHRVEEILSKIDDFRSGGSSSVPTEGGDSLPGIYPHGG